MAKTTSQVSKSFIIAAVTCLLLGAILNWIAILMLSIAPSLSSDAVVKHIILNSSYVGLKGAALAGVMAMIMSTVDSYINSTSVIIVHDFLKTLKVEGVRNELFFARLVSLLIGASSLVLSLRQESLLDLLVITYSLYAPIVTIPFLMAIFGFRSTERSVILAMVAGLTTVLLWDYVLQIKVANSIPAGMLANLIVLVGSHYLLGQKGGWIGIKDNSELMHIRLERKRKWQKFYVNIKNFNIIRTCKNNSPGGDGLISILGFFVMISVFGSTHTLAKEYQVQYTKIIDIFYPMTLCSTSILIAYPLWLESWRRTGLIYVFWNLIAFFVLICFSFLMVLASGFSEVQLMVFMVNIIVICSFSKWQWSLFNILFGVILVTFLYGYYYPLAFSELGIISSEFKIVYLLLLISSSLVFFLKPKQEYQALTEKKNGHLNGRIGEQEKETQKALKLKSEFIRNISHEYNTPMTSIIGIAEVLSESGDKLTDQQRKEAASSILKGARRLNVFDNNIVSLSKLTKKGYKLQPEPIDLSSLIFERTSLCRKLYEENTEDREFIFDIEEEIVINGDEHYLNQLIDNLVINAITYCKKGKIIVALKRAETGIEFSISDEGIGIPKEELYDIFAEFTVSSRTKTPAGGRGVGLALAQRVVEVHGGGIKAESDGIKGATIRFVLPKNRL